MRKRIGWAAIPFSRGLAASKRGNCTIRGATRRRHAEGRLLMLQNPHRHRCAERRWARARPRCPRGKRGERQISFARNLTRSFFEMAHKRCNSNDCASKSEICGGELRATLVTGGHDWSVHSHMADQTRNPPRTRRQGGPKRGHSKQQGARGAEAPRAPSRVPVAHRLSWMLRPGTASISSRV